MQKWIKAPGVKISLLSVNDRSLKKLLKDSNFDRIIVDPAFLVEMPREVLKSRQILMVRLQIDRRSLEAARIRAGVIF